MPVISRFFILLATGMLFSFFSFGQEQKTNLSPEDNKFIHHLLENRFYEESIIQLKELKTLPFNTSAFDTINYFLGVSLYYKKELDSSNRALFLVTDKSSDILERAKILSAFNSIHLKDYPQAETHISSFNFNDAVLGSFAKVEMAAISLLKRDTAAFRQQSNVFDENNNYAVVRAQKALLTHYRSMKEIKIKSPLLAGFSSAIIPGLGKAYIGKPGQGISSFLICAVLGVQAWEAYSKSSWRSPYFFLYSGLFGIFYTGNIYGSVHGARNYNNEKYEAIRTQLLIDLHIPLRSVLEL